MATPRDLTDHDSDRNPPPADCRRKQTTAALEMRVKDLQVEVDTLQQCLRHSLNLQKTILDQWDSNTKMTDGIPSTRACGRVPVAASTPYLSESSHRGPELSGMAARGRTLTVDDTPRSGVRSLDMSNTTRVLAAALHQAKLEPPVFADDDVVSPDDWLQSVGAYKSSLELSDAQILHELPRFLAKGPRKWFGVLATHIVTWNKFRELFKMAFLPSDSQEHILRGLLDRVQGPEEPLPIFVAHMLSEFKKLRNPPSDQEQIELICKHALEKYRVALCGTSVNSVIELMLCAHDLHTVLGPNTPKPPRAQAKPNPASGAYCFKCGLPNFTTRSCPNCSSTPTGPSRAPEPTNEQPRHSPLDPTAVHADNEDAVATTRQFSRKQGNFRGGRTFHRGDPPPQH